MVTEYTSKDNHKEVLKRIKGRISENEIDIDNVSDRLDVLIQQGVASPFYFEVNKKGELYVYYDDGFGPPNIEYDTETGNLYWIFNIED